MRLAGLVLLLLIATRNGVRANWWYLGVEPRIISHGGHDVGVDVPTQIGAGVMGPASAERNCKNSHLTSKQQVICVRSPPVLQAIGAGARLAIEECQHQFKSARWNCTINPDNADNVFGGVMHVNSREAAFVYAVSAAGVAYSVTRACSRGELTDCSCDNRVRTRQHSSNWQWGGCSEDIHFGERFSREWSEASEEPIKYGAAHGPQGLAGLLMRKHDSEAGRRAVRSRMQRVCKCHGMSGSCSVRVCWRRLPTFRSAGTALAQLHEGAALVRLAQRGSHRPARLRPARPELKRPNKTDLVYLEDSPDYCERNLTLGIPGTKGRICNRTSLGLDGCRLLCCGRGYQTRVRDVIEKCNCRFVWCCDVKCELCKHTREEHVCN
ncbi:PREDICTED: protein Wnt-1-like [Ceratosolen solmsi marchali]|uniref:Protein Wnt n=1 Tax=Ceratosolen solmsi marchali TaxID=326594 RepID=A0AAJ7DVU2_9HYME|nr:PREDICTED: protein Wnt-1-like [Ceratosolen solmsi marchali]